MVLEIDDQIHLKPIRLEDAEVIFTNFNENIIQYIPMDRPPDKVEETMAFIRSSIEGKNQGTDLVWTINYEEEFAGCCGIHTIQSKQPHFGLWVKQDLQARGIGKRVVHFMLSWGISNLDVEFIKYPVDSRNTKSLRLIEGLDLVLADEYSQGEQKRLEIKEYRLYKK